MELKRKLSRIKNKIASNYQKTRQSDVGDLYRIYRRFLKELPKVSHLKNVVLFSGIATMLIFVLFAQRFAALEEYLPVKPALGGSYTEGVVGQIKQLNPLFSPTNPAEDAATSLIFSSLLEKGDDRNVYPDLAEKWEISKDGKTYKFYLRNNIFWHDGEKVTADDVIYTIETIQKPDTESPLRSIWENVKVSTYGENEITFTLEKVYAPFIYNFDVPIIPRHIFEKTPVDNLRFSELSLKPIGSGPYIFDEFIEIKDSQEVHLIANDNFYGNKPYIEKVNIKTYPSYQNLTEAYTKKDIQGMERLVASEIGKDTSFPNLSQYNLSVPQYDVLYFNMREQSKMNNLSLREAISMIIDREVIIKEVYGGHAIPIFSPILPGYLGYNREVKETTDLIAAQQKLKNANYVLSENGILTKYGENISLRLLTSDNYTQKKEAELIAEMIKKLGIEVIFEDYPFSVLSSDYIPSRDFDLILISQNIGSDSDIYAFYHSNFKDDPGLNLSGLSLREVDKYLEQARTTNNTELRKSKYLNIVKLINNNKPATFLVWPDYIYAVSKEVKGIKSQKLTEPKDRFWNIEDWYIVTK